MELARSVAEAASEKAFANDPRSGLKRENAQHLADVARAIGVKVPMANQVEQMQYKQSVMQMLGVGRPMDRGSMAAARQADQAGTEFLPFVRPASRRSAQGFLPTM